jgi:plastocyanin
MSTKAIFVFPMLMSVTLFALAEPPEAVPTAAPKVAVASDATTISIKEFMFAPTAMTVPVGTSVRWKNLDGEPHTVRSIDATFSSNALDQNDSFTFKFDKPGTYRYVCSIHPQMVGTIVVKAAN